MKPGKRVKMNTDEIEWIKTNSKVFVPLIDLLLFNLKNGQKIWVGYPTKKIRKSDKNEKTFNVISYSRIVH